VRHTSPSSIGIETIFRSHGEIPEVFLRGAGVPDSFITFAKSLVGKPFDFYSCFISHSSVDHEFAERLHADLQAKGVRCWYAPEDLKIGDRFRTRINEAIRIHDKLLIILSENSVRSTWVETEVETAFERERRESRTVLFPIRIDDAVMETGAAWAADIRRTRHIGDFRNWKNHDSFQTAFNRLLRDLKAEGRPLQVLTDVGAADGVW
jgi:TIR domain